MKEILDFNSKILYKHALLLLNQTYNWNTLLPSKIYIYDIKYI